MDVDKIDLEVTTPERRVLAETVDYDGDLSPIVDFWTKFYARTDDKHEPDQQGPARSIGI